jgi:hypothetical protein
MPSRRGKTKRVKAMSDPYDYEFVYVNSIPNTVNGFASNESGTRRQDAWASPRAAAAAASAVPAASPSIPGLPGIPKDLNGVSPDLIALTFGAASNQNLDTMRAIANSVKNRIGLNVRGLVNLRSYDDVIYQHNSINPWYDNEGYPILDEEGYFIAGHPSNQYDEIKDKQMENAYKVLTDKNAKVSELGGPDNEQALIRAFKAAEEVYHGNAPDNTIPASGGRGAAYFHDRGIPTPRFIVDAINRGILREITPPPGVQWGMRFYGYTEQGYQKERVNP